ncbi:hypothetical protein [Tateyamaria pelophila]|uniref:hypothetical protein n=1 Tax=Tateyamaria pelophila TaxID=328415 RepID=UPI001CBC2B30|nr:hypothetical protein [Tateyamaria pelophila]
MGHNRFNLCLVAVAAAALFILTLAASTAFAQIADSSLVIPADVEVRGRGWSQIINISEMLDFTLTVLETTVLTAFLVFHPSHFRQRASNVDMRKGMFLFSFIGMLTGFLVLHHGYLIGFVIFGIGGLFRFRMESSSIADTGKLVIVSLIGLAAGLDLPVMSLVAAVAAWIVIWAFGGSEKLTLEVKFDEQAEPQLAMLRLQDHLVQNGFSVSSVSKTKFKPTAQYLLIARKSEDQTRLIREMVEVRSQSGSGVVDWQVE